MAAAQVPDNEAARLVALQRYEVLDTPPEEAFDEIAELAAYVCGTASALITLVDEERQWFKARAEFSGTETPREIAFCAYTILQRDVFEVRDATADPRFADNVLVTGEPHIRFYAGAPLITADGFAIGSVAAIDYVPHQLDDTQKRALVVLSHQVVAQLELRRRLEEERKRSELAARQGLERFELVARATNDAVWDWDLRTDAIWWNDGFQTLFGYGREEIGLDITSWTNRIHPVDLGSVQQSIDAVIDSGATSWSSEYRFRRSVKVVDEAEPTRRPELSPGRYACLEVRDTGAGVDPEVLPHVFEPFFTTKPVGKGTGLGLATVYGIVQQHDGWIDVTSEPGTGTTFSIYLPVAEPTAPAGLHRASDIAGSLAGTETILVVEDEDNVRLLVVNLLERHGYTVLQAASGAAALETWQQARDQIDLLLTDLVMPGGMTGRELAGRLRADRPELKVVYTSGYSVEVTGPGEALIDGLNFLQKPYHPKKLAQTVREQLDRS